MEFLNRIEVRGIVGRATISQVGGATHADFSLMTNYAYRAPDGKSVIETAWFSVHAFEGEKIRQLEQLEKGLSVYVSGRLRIQRYTGADGSERSLPEIVAHELRLER